MTSDNDQRAADITNITVKVIKRLSIIYIKILLLIAAAGYAAILIILLLLIARSYI